MTWHIMVAEIFIKNRLDALLKPIVGTNLGRNAPLIKANDTKHGVSRVDGKIVDIGLIEGSRHFFLPKSPLSLVS